jgi:hypothetical protein
MEPLDPKDVNSDSRLAVYLNNVLSKIASTNQEVKVEVSPESKIEEEQGESYLKKEAERCKAKMAQTEADSFEDRRQDRKNFTYYLFQFVCMWLVFVGFIVLWNGLGKLKYSDTVLVTILTTTTSGVLLYFHYVLKYLFGDKK